MPSSSDSRSISDSIHKNSEKLNIIFTFKFTAQWQITSSSSSFCSWKLNNLSRNELFFALSQQETFPLHQLCKIWVYILRSAFSMCSLISESSSCFSSPPLDFSSLTASLLSPESPHSICSLLLCSPSPSTFSLIQNIHSTSRKNHSSRSEFSSQVSQDFESFAVSYLCCLLE